MRYAQGLLVTTVESVSVSVKTPEAKEELGRGLGTTKKKLDPTNAEPHLLTRLPPQNSTPVS